MNKTQNYQLNQWEAEDRVLRTDFNADNAKIDAALKALAAAAATIPKIAAGHYTGSGSSSRTISVGFTPKAVLVFPAGGGLTGSFAGASQIFGGLAVTGSPVTYSYRSENYTAMEIASGGFRVIYRLFDGNYEIATNDQGKTYHYIAVG